MIKRKLQKSYAKYKVWKHFLISDFFDALIILKYAINNKEFPHGDDEYNKILGKENQCI